MANQVTFHLSVDRRGMTEHVSARVLLPTGRELSVSYHPFFVADGRLRPTLILEGLEVYDLHRDDVFCSEMFFELTGRYPFEVETYVDPNRDYAPFPGS